jgi:lysophospholipase L1-like esterase
MTRASAVLRGLARSCLTTIIFFSVAEAGLRATYAARNALVRRIPLPYALGDEYGPIPPWLDRLLILVPDDALIWHEVPHARRTYVDVFSPVFSADDRSALLRRFVPWLPAGFRDNPTWSIALNGEGFRSPELAPRRPGVVRIACIGDSWTFGMNVDQDRSYPARLAAKLAAARPSARFEVLNFGVLGYTSFQGLQLLTRRVLDLHPDIVAIGFGMNDSEVAGYRDKDMVTVAAPIGRERLLGAAAELESYKLLRYAALRLRFRPKPIADYLREEEADTGGGAIDYDEIEPWTRVSPRDYERNVREMVRLAAAAGARPILLDNELWGDSPYSPILKRLSAALDVPLVDSYQLIRDAREALEREHERRLGLAVATSETPQASESAPPESTDRITVVFRVRAGAYPVASSLSIVGTDPQLGGLVPNRVRMRDDGSGGDERAGDGVWSVSAALRPGTRVVYVYTNSGRPGRWEGLDVPALRHVVVPRFARGPVYLPIETFGKIDMQADNWHTDAAGYDLIADAVARAITSTRQERRTSTQNPQDAQRAAHYRSLRYGLDHRQSQEHDGHKGHKEKPARGVRGVRCVQATRSICNAI